MKNSILVLLTALFCLTAEAQESQTVYNFLRLPASAHVAALGGQNISIIEDDPSLVFSNPALLASVENKTVGLNYMTYMEGVKTASAAFCRTVNDKASWAVLAQYMDYGSMLETDENNNILGDFAARDIALGGTFSYLLARNLVGGITAKFITSYIAGYSSTAVGVDLGLNYYHPESQWSASLVAKNLGGQLKAYNDDYERLPLDLQAGVSKRFAVLPFRVSATLDNLNHWHGSLKDHLVLGLDVILSSQLYLAGGYGFRQSNEMNILGDEYEESSHSAGFSFGAGLQLDRFKVQVGYAKYHVSASSIVLSCAYKL